MNTILSILDFDFNFNLFEYWDVIKQYVNPAKVAAWAIIGGVIGFLIVLIAEIILYKKILVRRRHWSLKYLSYLYMVFFPLFAGFCFTQWFAYHGCQRELVRNIPTYLGDANQLFNAHLKQSIVDFVGEKHLDVTGDQAIDKTLSYADELVNYLAVQGDESMDTKLSGYVFGKILETEIVKSQMRSKIDETIGETLKMDKDMTQEFLDIKLMNILDDGVLNTVIEQHIKSLFGGLKSKALLIFILGLALPLIEIIVANRMDKKRRTPPPSPQI